MPDELTPDTFRPHIGTEFVVDVEGGDPLVLTLEAVETLGRGHELRAEPFSLAFAGPPDRMAPQGTFTLRHAALGELEIFVVPVEPGRYQALFN